MGYPFRFILGLGDSLMEGVPSPNTPFLNLIGSRRQSLNFAVNNAGEGGERTDQTLARYRSNCKGRGSYTDAIILTGTNDAAQGIAVATAQTNYLTLVNELLAELPGTGTRVYCCTLLPRKGSAQYSVSLQTWLDTFNNWLRTSLPAGAVAVETGAAVADGTDPLLLAPAYECSPPDKLHLGPNGHARLADVFDAIFPLP